MLARLIARAITRRLAWTDGRRPLCSSCDARMAQKRRQQFRLDSPAGVGNSQRHLVLNLIGGEGANATLWHHQIRISLRVANFPERAQLRVSISGSREPRVYDRQFRPARVAFVEIRRCHLASNDPADPGG